MDIAGIQNAMVGMALFDMWDAAVHKSGKCHKGPDGKPIGSPLVAAAAAAFEQYIDATETQMAAQITALATYALTPKGGAAQLLTSKDMAPFLALNVLA